MVVVEISQQGHRQADVADLEAGQVHLFIGLFSKIGEGPLLLGGLEELHLEVSALADEEGAGDHLAGVAADQGHLPGERSSGEVQEQVLFLEQLNVIPQGVKGQVHGTSSFLW